MSQSKKARYLSDEVIKALGLQPITKKLPDNPLAADEQILLSGGNLAILEPWVVDEIVARSAERVWTMIAELKEPEHAKKNPDLLSLQNLLLNTNAKLSLSSPSRAASYVDWSKRRHVVPAVLAAQIVTADDAKKSKKGEKPRADDAFDLARRYLASIGVKMNLDTLKKNFYKWRGGATPHPSFMNYWIGELAPFTVKPKPDTESL